MPRGARKLHRGHKDMCGLRRAGRGAAGAQHGAVKAGVVRWQKETAGHLPRADSVQLGE